MLIDKIRDTHGTTVLTIGCFEQVAVYTAKTERKRPKASDGSVNIYANVETKDGKLTINPARINFNALLWISKISIIKQAVIPTIHILTHPHNQGWEKFGKSQSVYSSPHLPDEIVVPFENIDTTSSQLGNLFVIIYI